MIVALDMIGKSFSFSYSYAFFRSNIVLNERPLTVNWRL